MKRASIIATALFVAVLGVLTMNVKAQDFNPLEKTYLTFSAPVELPGMTLPAGTYTFRLADTPSRNVVQVLSQDEKTIHGQFLFVQAPRRDPSGETVVMFKETAEGTTPAVQYWYYPSEGIGKEFVYPKDQALKIAARTHATVLSTEGDIAAQPQVAAIDESGKVTPRQETSAAPQPERTVAQNPEPAAPAPAPAPAPQREVERPVGTSGQSTPAPAELPRTASPLPLTGLLGLFSLASGLGLRAFRR
jgi:hypothetical protein